jgi:hypothetical protein
MPELGLSEDVFSDRPREVEAEAPDAAADLPEQPGGEDVQEG